jgi:hypothetical protein
MIGISCEGVPLPGVSAKIEAMQAPVHVFDDLHAASDHRQAVTRRLVTSFE